jgi:hypothetical protein
MHLERRQTGAATAPARKSVKFCVNRKLNIVTVEPVDRVWGRAIFKFG